MIGWLDSILGRPRAVLSAMLVLVVAGLFAYMTIPKESNSDLLCVNLSAGNFAAGLRAIAGEAD